MWPGRVWLLVAKHQVVEAVGIELQLGPWRREASIRARRARGRMVAHGRRTRDKTDVEPEA